MLKRILALVFAAATGLAVALVPTAASAAGGPYCGIRWGSLAKQATSPASGTLDGVRAGRHACFDRLVIDVDGGRPAYWVRYVDQVRTDGAGFVVPLRGAAKLQVVAAVPAYDDTGTATYPISKRELVDVRGFRTFRQVAGAGSFEGQSTVGVGVRARLPFRVFTIAGPGAGQARLVVDVAHRW